MTRTHKRTTQRAHPRKSKHAHRRANQGRRQLRRHVPRPQQPRRKPKGNASSAGLTSCAELDPAGSTRAHDDGIERRRQVEGSRKPEREVDEDEVPSNPENRRVVPVRRRRVATQTVKRRGQRRAQAALLKTARPERRGPKGRSCRGAAKRRGPAASTSGAAQGAARRQPTASAPRRRGPRRGHEGAAPRRGQRRGAAANWKTTKLQN
jgi:hypothetical protein